MKIPVVKISKKKLRRIFEAFILLLALSILIPQFLDLIRDKEVISSISVKYVLVATAVHIFTPIFAAASYIYLSPKPISFLKSIATQYASGFTNRLLPSGAGALATVTSFLSKSGLSIPESLSLALVNNILGFFAFAIVMLVLKAYDLNNIKSLAPDVHWYVYTGISVVLIALVVAGITSKKLRTKIVRIFKEVSLALKQITLHPISTLMALMANAGITILHIASLALCIASVGYTLPIQITALVFATGIVAITVSPTPSGLGLTELALSASLKTFGLPTDQALVVAVSYRLVTYWIPILPGYIFYRLSRSKNII